MLYLFVAGLQNEFAYGALVGWSPICKLVLQTCHRQRDITNFNIDNEVLLDSYDDSRMIVCKCRFHKLSSWWAGIIFHCKCRFHKLSSWWAGIIFHRKLGDHRQSLSCHSTRPSRTVAKGVWLRKTT